MLFFENDKFRILCAPRCGHTSMTRFLGYEPYELDIWGDEGTGKLAISKWELDTDKTRVLVLRNPYDRINSTVKTMPILEEKLPQVSPSLLFVGHSHPFLLEIKVEEFKYIDFYKLHNYIGDESSDTFVTNTNNTSNNFYIENPKYSKDDLDEEYRLYLKILEEKEEMSVNEWKHLVE